MAGDGPTLDDLDPPAWPSSPPLASAQVRRSHALRSVPVRHFTPDDLRLMIEQRIALHVLVPVAIEALRARPAGSTASGHDGLLHALLTTPATYWTARPDDAASLREITPSGDPAHGSAPRVVSST